MDDLECLKNLVEKFQVCLRLSQFDEVSNLCLVITRKLVEFIDVALEDQSESGADDADSNTSLLSHSLIQLVDLINKKLRFISEIALIYHEVCNFVRLQDLSALARVVGALEIRSKNPLLNRISTLIKIVRQSIILIRYIKSDLDECEDLASKTGYISFDKLKLNAGNACRFETYQINDLEDALSSNDTNDNDTSSIGDKIKLIGIDEDPELVSQLRSTWFMHFVRNYLEKKLSFDRFTLLMAIWIAGVEGQCNNVRLDIIMNQLIDGTPHEEAPSSSVEDFIQLNQLGSIWLSERRRIKVYCLNQNISLSTSGHDEDQSDSNDSPDDDSESYNIDDSESKTTGDRLMLHENTKKELNQLIEENFLYGCECPLCADKQSGKLLASLELESCINCSSQLVVERCSLSYRPLSIIKLDSLLGFRPQLKSLTLIPGQEWLRFYLDASYSRDTKKVKAPPLGELSQERYQISENFQKLTIIRDNNDQDYESEGDSESSANDGVDESVTAEPWYCSILKAHMRERVTNKLVIDESGMAGESLHMIRYVRKEVDQLALNMCDIILFDDPSDPDRKTIRVGLNVSDGWRCWGPIMSCSIRSETSSLQIGCGRVFSSFELQRTNKNYDLCPFCSNRLIQLESLDSMVNKR